MKNYTYNDWIEGKVVLGYDYFLKKGMKKPIVVLWENFSKVERDKIKAVQRQLFLDEVNLLVQKFKEVFTARYEASLVKDCFRLEEIKQCEFILKGELPNMDLITLNHWQAVFKYSELLKIQQYYQDYVVKGMMFNYDFIHANCCKYVDTSIIHSSIYAQAVWEYFNWLQRLESSFKKNTRNSLTAPVIQLFCALVHQSKLMVMIDESAEDYCQRVCSTFNLKYTVNVRKYFSPEVDITKKNMAKNLKMVIEFILPSIKSSSDKKQIETYIESKKMYR